MRSIQWHATFLAGILLNHASQAAQTTNVLSAHRVAELKSVTSAAIAPDGSFIAYTVAVPRQPGVDQDGPPWSELWVVPWEGEPRPFISGPVNIEHVRWTPDSRNIAFLAKRGEDKTDSLYLIPVDGGEARRAAALETDITAFSLAPDGQRAALAAREAEPEVKKKERDKGFKQEIYEEEWRPSKIWLTTLFSTETNRQPLQLDGSIHQVHWSPVDDRLLVASAPTPSVDDSYMEQRVRIVYPHSPEIIRLDNPGKLGEIAWSPDGKRVCAISAADVHDPSPGRLMIAAAEGGSWRDALPGMDAHLSHPTWHDKETLTCLVHYGTKTYLGRVDLSVSEPANRIQPVPAHLVCASLSASTDGARMAYVAHSSKHPAELFTARAGEQDWNRRTESNPWLHDLRLAPQEVVRHHARDGLELEGVLIRPLDEKEGQRYPLILSVHGGPESHVSDGWLTSYSLPGQVAAARGFAVFYPNYRGSTGRGVAFSKLGQGDPAGKEFDDLIDAVDHLIDIGLADRARVGITGGSYGGYATAWCSTRYSDRFAAGVMFVGISDKISKVGTTDIPNEEYYVHALHRPWEAWQLLLERSPIYHAGNSKTPLLILHGKDDPRVNVGQSRELYRHLKLHNQAPVRLVLYPGEVHGNRKAAARLDYNLRMLRWMEHYLQGPGGQMPAPDVQYDK